MKSVKNERQYIGQWLFYNVLPFMPFLAIIIILISIITIYHYEHQKDDGLALVKKMINVDEVFYANYNLKNRIEHLKQLTQVQKQVLDIDNDALLASISTKANEAECQSFLEQISQYTIFNHYRVDINNVSLYIDMNQKIDSQQIKTLCHSDNTLKRTYVLFPDDTNETQTSSEEVAQPRASSYNNIVINNYCGGQEQVQVSTDGQNSTVNITCTTEAQPDDNDYSEDDNCN